MAIDKKTREEYIKIDIDPYKEEKKERNGIVEKEFSLLAKNIAFFRFRYGETQKTLAEAIGVEHQSISRYEQGTQLPSRKELFLIAERYDTSVDALLNYDFSSDFVEMDVPINALNKDLIYSTLFPIVYNDNSMDNVHFKEAFDLHCEIKKRLCEDKDGFDFASININKCTRLYNKAVEDGVLAASANLLWWPMIQSVTLAFFNKKIINVKSLKSNKATVRDVLRESLLIGYFDLEDNENEDFKDGIEHIIRSNYLGTIIHNISLLKNSGEPYLCNLADYYIAIAYKYNVLSIGRLSKNQGRIIGEEILRTLHLIGNNFAKEYYSVFKNQDNID